MDYLLALSKFDQNQQSWMRLTGFSIIIPLAHRRLWLWYIGCVAGMCITLPNSVDQNSAPKSGKRENGLSILPTGFLGWMHRTKTSSPSSPILKMRSITPGMRLPPSPGWKNTSAFRSSWLLVAKTFPPMDMCLWLCAVRNVPFEVSGNAFDALLNAVWKTVWYCSRGKRICRPFSTFWISRFPKSLTSPIVPVRRFCFHCRSSIGTAVLRAVGQLSLWRSALRFAPAQNVFSIVVSSSPMQPS